ncbi:MULTISPECIES: PilW family protein [unclassified Variovorax]|jgi:type IV pilus assembly protein PilW|uniref:PilW family protein n=1 Tax=unclassified Variovorax TaxID=663243 RepID=UPI000F7E9481|nr:MULTISPECIES: PilW family protein [unclassified Variovorax]RSZ34470.1 prepilin-type N-terminal cleavage/methylation domain-containing protein [Variovorax sp. 553]RSZ34966.1 prepilin-type N-terminal cleavage/methylation domain-containing protein [Variovorax sp. 679]
MRHAFPTALPFRQRGLSLIELLVAMVIGLVVTLAVTSVITVGEAKRRTTTSTNDMDQAGAYASYLLDRALRSAGSSLSQSTQPTDRGVFGCKLNAASLLPSSNAFPAPFKKSFLAGAPANLRVAPLLIAKSQSDAGSDVLVVMGGDAVAGGVPRGLTDPGSATTLSMDNTVGISTGDLVLVSQNGTTDCLLEQVTGTSAKVLTVGGTYYTAGKTTSLQTLAASTSTYVTPLGNPANGNVQFQLFGVGDNSTLYGYDLLQGGGTTTAQALADGVIQMRALYGLDTNGDGILDAWADPGATGYDIATVMTTTATLRQIVAVRVALVMRSASKERDPVSSASLTLFGDAVDAAKKSLAQTVSLNGTDDQNYRYRVVDFTVPLRNMLLLP